MAWYDFFKVFTYAFTEDPLAKKSHKDMSGAGVSQPDAMPDVRAGQDGMSSGGQSSIRLRDTTDFVDFSSVKNRIHRYKEYERLRSMAEIEMAMTVFADEACFAGETEIEAPSYGTKTIKWLAENLKDERFLVYCYDFSKRDYTLGWAYNPRKTKHAYTIKVLLDDGSHFICTPDHRILSRDGSWIQAGELEYGSELMPFYKLPARQDLTNIKTNQFPRIWTHSKGWIHERQFVDEWNTGIEKEDLQIVNKYCRMVAEGLPNTQIKSLTGNDISTIKNRMERAGFSNKEMKWLGKKPDRRRVVGIQPHKEIDVYDISVEKHKNFCTNWGVAHNCQKDDDGRVVKFECKNKKIQEELEYLFFHRKMLNFDQKKAWNTAKQLFVMGDFFWEIVIDPEDPKSGILNLVPLPADSMFRIETTKGKLVEFQQSKESPDYESLANVDIHQATEAELQQSTAVRFTPEQIVHIRIGDDRKTFYPYGISLIEPARGPAHQLRLMEDAMVVYRLTRAPERRVFYIDVQNLPSYKAEAFMERMKDQFRKKKVSSNHGSSASSVEERWHAPAADEDYWIPLRSNSANTRIETLPGAQNLGEIDDTVYFRNKLFTALNFPKNYFNNEDAQSTRISLSAQDVKFARMIERFQSHMEDAFWEICDRHLRLLGYTEESYEDLVVKMTPPSDWRELTRAEVLTNRLNNMANLKGSQLMSDFDILVDFGKYSEDDAKKMIAKLKVQKIDDLKLQIIAQNPTLLGVGLPGPDDMEIGTEPGGPNPMLGNTPEPQAAPPPQGMKKYMDDGEDDMMPQTPVAGSSNPIPIPEDDDIKKFNLEIKDFESEIDEEEQDLSDYK